MKEEVEFYKNYSQAHFCGNDKVNPGVTSQGM
jgi:hypothetical protein